MTNEQIKAFLEKLVGSADKETSWEMSYKVLKGGVESLREALQVEDNRVLKTGPR